MKQVNSIWTLSKKHGYCQYCEDQSFFRFISCGGCGELLLECDEEHIFIAKLPISGDLLDSICPQCSESTLHSKPAESDSIKNAGFLLGDYE